MPDYTNTYEQGRRQKEMANDAQNSELFRALTQQQADRQSQLASQAHADQAQQVSGQQAQDLAKYKDQLGQEGTTRNISTLSDLMKTHPGMGGSIGENGNVSLTKPIPDPMRSLAAERFKDKQVENLSKRAQKSASTYDTVNELEASTNADGKGGILTNPDAHLKSYGKYASYVPTSLVGAAETLHLMPPGSQQERANTQAFFNDYAHEKFGARVTPEQYQRELTAHGLTGGGDPALAEKAIRQRVSNLQAGDKAMEAGYSPEVREQFHAVSPDKMSDLQIYNDSAPKPSLSKFIGGKGGKEAPPKETPRQMLNRLRNEQGGQ